MAAILAAPYDMAIRLVYSDWCEEQGDQPRAQVIRAQVRGDEKLAEALLHRHRMRWDGAILRRFNAVGLRVHCRRGPVHRWEYRRGLVESVTVRPSAFLDHGDELLSIGPVHEVRFVRGPVPWETLASSPLLSGLRTIRVRACEHRDARWAAWIAWTLGAQVFRRRMQNTIIKGFKVEREAVLAGKPGRLRVVIEG